MKKNKNKKKLLLEINPLKNKLSLQKINQWVILKKCNKDKKKFKIKKKVNQEIKVKNLYKKKQHKVHLQKRHL